MRWTLVSLLCIFTLNNVLGQKNLSENEIMGNSPINVGLDEVKKLYVPPVSGNIQLKSAMSKECDINVTYLNFPEEAKKAFEFAIAIWEQNISSPVPINILAKWENLNGNEIANCQAATFLKNFQAAPLNNVYYPIALVEKLMDKEMNGSKDADIICKINGSVDWYLGTNGQTPDSKYDLVTVALHEITHGLGFSGFFDDDNGVGMLSNPTNSPSAYDYYVFNLQNQRIADNNIFRSPSDELHNQLTSNNLNFNYNDEYEVEGTAKIFAPATWNPGGSIYHLKSYNVNPEVAPELMSPFTYKGEAIHNPGENTLHIISEIGWSAVMFKMAEIGDIEETCAELPVETNLSTTLKINQSSVQIIYSYDYFKSSDSVKLVYNNSTNQFEGKLPVNFRNGKVQYYYSATTDENRTCTFPNHAPSNLLNFKIGPDFYPPILEHNPIKMVSSSESTINFSATATDNLGISSVKVEFRINGISQEPLTLSVKSNDTYSGILSLPANLNEHDLVEYRVVAEDNSNRKNKQCMPSNGYYSLDVAENYEPVKSYESDFETLSNDFAFSDFEISVPAGLVNAALHTLTPYAESQVTGEKQNSVAQLKYPVILSEKSQLSFDEIVLVEPGETGSVYTDANFWDFVIVEASNDFGKSWMPLTDGYDSGMNELWAARFTSSLKSNISYASASEDMYLRHTINLTNNETLYAGDTVIIRFRLSTDHSVNGWGWAIDNLKIMDNSNKTNDIIATENVSVYPNPFTTSVFIDCNSLVSDQSSVDIMIADLTGKTVYHETNFDIKFNPKLQLDLSSIRPGIYLASITDENFNIITKRIIKN